MKQTKPTPGGKRKGAGRPKGEPTKPIGKRVPVKYYKYLTAYLDAELKRLRKQGS